VPVAVESITPGRGRAADAVVIDGQGFSPFFGQNLVTFGGLPAGVNAFSAEQLSIVIPVGLAVDQHVPVVVTNLDDASSATWYWWSKDTIANTNAMVLRTKIPGLDEKLRGLERSRKDMRTAEARFFERIATKILLLRDLLNAKGKFFSMAAADLGLRGAAVGTAGQPFLSSIDTAGGQFQDRHCQTMQWGYGLSGAPELTATMITAGRDNTTIVLPQSTSDVALFSGQIAIVSVRNRLSATSRINRIEILANGVVVADVLSGSVEFPGPGLNNGQSITFYPGLKVAQGDRVQVRVSRNNATTDCFVLAYALVV